MAVRYLLSLLVLIPAVGLSQSSSIFKDPLAFVVEVPVIDQFGTGSVNDAGGTRYIYCGDRCNGHDTSQLTYDPAEIGWWDTDGNGTCAKLEYINKRGNRYGGVSTLGTYLAPNCAEFPLEHVYRGITFWAASDYGSDDDNDPSRPKGQVQICSSVDCGYSWLGDAWHQEFPLTYNWRKFALYFEDFSPPVIIGDSSTTDISASTQSLFDALYHATAIEFQQANSDRAKIRATPQPGNIYIDDVRLFFYMDDVQ